MKIKYWTSFSKRKNSTLTPTGGTEIDAVLKGPTSELNPVFELQGVTSAKYVYCATFGRYYYVTDVLHLSNNVIQISCAVDVMSSHKGSIGATYADVEYTSSSTNTDIADPRNHPTNVLMTKSTSAALTGGDFITTGAPHYVVGLAVDQGVGFYQMAANNFNGLIDNVYNGGFISQLENQFYGLSNVILSCSVMPRMAIAGFTSLSVSGHNICSGERITDSNRLITIYDGTLTLDYPSDDLGYDFSYLDCAPYTSGSIYLPFVGCVDLPVDMLATTKSVYIKGKLDQCTGDIMYVMGVDSSKIIATYSGNCAASLPVSGQTYNAIGALTSGASIIGGAGTLIAGIATENPLLAAGGVGGMFGGGVSMAQSLSHQSHTNGSISTIVGITGGTSIVATISTRRPAEVAIDSAYKYVSGMPYYKGATISALSGYVKCAGASVSISGYDSEREEINGYLNSGFYYE